MKALPAELQEGFLRDFRQREKSIPLAYVVWLTFGWHYLYLGRIGLQFAFWFTCGGFGLWWLVDVFLLAGYVERLNEHKARELIAQYRTMANVPQFPTCSSPPRLPNT